MSDCCELLSLVWQPHVGQREFLESEARFKVLACGRRWGKTDACAAEVVLSLFAPSPTRHILIAPTQDQAGLLFDRIVSLLRELEPGQNLDIRKSPHPRLAFAGHRVTARSGHVARSLRGNEATHIVIDEAAFVPESLITEVALPMLATTNGRMTLISTPNGRNHFYRFFNFGLVGEHGVWSRRGPSSESPYVSQEFLAIQRDLVPERAFAIEYEAEFRDSVGQFFRTEAIDQCVNFELPLAQRPIVVGLDFGRIQDYTALAVVQGSRESAQLLALDCFQEPAWGAIVARVSALVSRYPGAKVAADATGNGDAVVEMLRGAIPNRINPVVFANQNKNKMLDDLAAMFENRRLLMRPDPDLMRELQHFHCTQSEHGNRKLGAAAGIHDDRVIALALAVNELRAPCRPVLLGSPRNL